MSEFIAQAQVLVRPDVSKFRAELLAELKAATTGVVIPVAVTPVAASGVQSVATATQALAAEQQKVIASSAQVAGAQAQIARSAEQSTASLLGAATASGKLDAALLGLRTAIGSSAVIGLGALSLGAIAAGQSIRASLQNFAQFQQELSTFRATSGATAEQLKAVSDQAQALGEDVRLPAVSAADAAVAMTELAKAGLSVEDAMAGARGVLELATAAQISNAAAAQIAANALNAFGLAGDQAVNVADDLANAANASQGSISDMGLALQQASAVARQVGLSLQDTVSLLSLFAKNGLQGSDAGTSLRVALIKLVAPTKAAADEIKTLGINVRDAQGNLRPDVFAQFGQATQDLAPAARDAAAALIFGQDAIRAVSIGAREGTQGLRLMQFQIDQTGTASELANARTEGLAGAFSGLQSNASTLSIQFGKLLSLGLTPYVSALSGAIGLTNKFASALDDLATSALNVETPLGKVKDRLFDIASVGFPLIGEARLIGAGLDRLGIGSDDAAKKVKDLQDELQNLQSARIAAEQGGAPDIADRLTAQIKAVRAEIKSLKGEGEGLNQSLTKPLQDAINTLEKVRQTRIDLNVNTGPIDRLIASLREEIPAAQEAARETANMARGMDGVTFSAQQSAGAVDNLTRAIKDLTRQSSVLDAQLLKLQNENASPQAIILNRQADIAAQNKIISDLKANGNQPGDATAIKAAREKIEADQAEIATQQGLLAAASQKAATEAKKKSDEIANNQEEATKNFIAGFDPKKQKILNAITAAGLTERLSDDIKFEKQLVAFLRNEVNAIKQRIKNLHLHGAALKAAQAAITAINQEIFNTTQEIAKDQAAAIQKTQDILLQKADARIAIAQARGDVGAEIKARRARLEIITKELAKLKNAGKKNTLAWLELKAQQIEETKAINELEGKTKEKSQTQSQFFNFLQSQEGFAHNLLGNLIPGFATAGLVGDSAPTAARTAFDKGRRADVGVPSAAAVGAARAATVRPVQVDTTNSLLRQILAALNGRHTQPPEARFQRHEQNAAFDGVHGN